MHHFLFLKKHEISKGPVIKDAQISEVANIEKKTIEIIITQTMEA